MGQVSAPTRQMSLTKRKFKDDITENLQVVTSVKPKNGAFWEQAPVAHRPQAPEARQHEEDESGRPGRARLQGAPGRGE